MNEEVDKIIKESGLEFTKIDSMFKTTYKIKDITIEVTERNATVFDGGSYFSAPLDERMYCYIQTVIGELK